MPTHRVETGGGVTPVFFGVVLAGGSVDFGSPGHTVVHIHSVGVVGVETDPAPTVVQAHSIRVIGTPLTEAPPTGGVSVVVHRLSVIGTPASN